MAVLADDISMQYNTPTQGNNTLVIKRQYLADLAKKLAVQELKFPSVLLIMANIHVYYSVHVAHVTEI